MWARRFLLAVVFSIAMQAQAFAAPQTSTVFPPVTVQNQPCGSDQLRVLSWAAGATSTVCLTGQEVMTLAIPSCTPNQEVIYDGGKFVCQSPVTIPTCTAEQYLSYEGGTYICKSTITPTCSANQVLTNTGSGLTCVQRTDAIPTCSANQYLTFNGSTYQCATSQQVVIPTCGANQYATANGSSFSCADLAATGGGGAVLSGTLCGSYTVGPYGALIGGIACNGSNPPTCPAGYSSTVSSFRPMTYVCGRNANSTCNDGTTTYSCYKN